jgi:hypothetical protein
MTAAIPANPGALTPEWLTQALRSTRTITNAWVTSCRVQLFGEGKGFGGQLARVGLDYDCAVVAIAPVPGDQRSGLIASFTGDPRVRIHQLGRLRGRGANAWLGLIPWR